MNKPTLFYTLRKCWRIGGFKIMRVTTEKPRQFYGSDLDGMPTHCAPRETVGRFDSEEEAQSRIDRVALVKKRFAPRFEYIRKQERELEELQRREIDAIVQTEDTEAVLLLNRGAGNGGTVAI